MIGTTRVRRLLAGRRVERRRARPAGVLRRPRASAPRRAGGGVHRRPRGRLADRGRRCTGSGVPGMRSGRRRGTRRRAGARVRPHARADRAGLRRRALLLAAGLPRAGDRRISSRTRWATARTSSAPRRDDRLRRGSARPASGTSRSAALVIGHVAGLVLAHDRALAMYRSPRDGDALAVLDARGHGRASPASACGSCRRRRSDDHPVRALRPLVDLDPLPRAGRHRRRLARAVDLARPAPGRRTGGRIGRAKQGMWALSWP